MNLCLRRWKVTLWAFWEHLPIPGTPACHLVLLFQTNHVENHKSFRLGRGRGEQPRVTLNQELGLEFEMLLVWTLRVWPLSKCLLALVKLLLLQLLSPDHLGAELARDGFKRVIQTSKFAYFEWNGRKEAIWGHLSEGMLWYLLLVLKICLVKENKLFA